MDNIIQQNLLTHKYFTYYIPNRIDAKASFGELNKKLTKSLDKN